MVRVRQEDERETVFNTPLGQFKYLVMPSGFTSAPAVFQNPVNDVLRDYINSFVFVYLDDDLLQEPGGTYSTCVAGASETIREPVICES